MLGTIIDFVAIIVGSFVGIIVRKGIKDEYKKIIIDGLGLSVIVIGITGSIKADNIILVIISILLGSIIGEAINIESKLHKIGDRLQSRFARGESNFVKGFVTASLIYCIGAMAIVGSLESGLLGNHNILFAKSILDGVLSVVFASTLGIGVVFSAIPVLIYQGIITLIASSVKDLLTPEVINEMSAVGGILILAIGINILELKKIRIGNMLPAVFIPLFYSILTSFFNF